MFIVPEFDADKLCFRFMLKNLLKKNEAFVLYLTNVWSQMKLHIYAQEASKDKWNLSFMLCAEEPSADK